jgi:hypothetical protein
MCDDIRATVAELKAHGIEFSSEIVEERWGLTATFELPGAGRMSVYQPRDSRPSASVS